MSDSKNSNKKTNKSNNVQSKKLRYAFILLLMANIIVFGFFLFFISKLHFDQHAFVSGRQIQPIDVPVVNNQQDINVSALSYVVYDPLTRATIYSKNEDMRLSPASSIKILTALVALDEYNVNNYLTVNTTATIYESRMGLILGEQISVENLLYGLLLVSGNDAAKTLAYNYPGGMSGFVNAMNKKASEIGLSESNFLDPSGYQDNNYSTAYDLALLGSHAMKNDKIREIVGTEEYVVYGRNNLNVHPLNNLNELLVDSNVTGIKTGFTNEAGGVLITSYVHDGRELIIVVMKSENRFADTREIMEAIDNGVNYSEVSPVD